MLSEFFSKKDDVGADRLGFVGFPNRDDAVPQMARLNLLSEALIMRRPNSACLMGPLFWVQLARETLSSPRWVGSKLKVFHLAKWLKYVRS